MRPRRLVCLFVIVIATLGCASPVPDTVVGCPAALIEGVLVVHDRETAILAGPDLSPIIWPPGYSLQGNGGRTDVLDERGNTVATTGEFVRLGGGYITGNDRWTTCGPPLERR